MLEQKSFSKDIIFIKDLKILTLIGVNPQEKIQKQPIIIDLEINTNAKKSAATDNLTDAINYEQLCQKVIDFVESSNFNLLETLAEKLANFILHSFQISYVKLAITKSQALTATSKVGITIERGQN